MKTVMAGPGGNYHPGEIADLATADAYALCEGGYAEQIVPSFAVVETAAVVAVETATAPAQTKKPRRRM